VRISILGTEFVIRVPDREWRRFLELMWRPFLVASTGERALVAEITPHEVWNWELRAAGEPLGMGPDRWFLAGELRYWLARHAVENSVEHLLHAAVVSRGDRALLLLADSGGGKTTLSLALRELGWAYHGDDLARIDPETTRARGLPTPIGIRDTSRWRELSALWDGAAPWEPDKSFLIPAAPLVAPENPLLEVGALAFLSYEWGAEPAAERLTPGTATIACARQSATRTAAAIESFAHICRTATCARLTYGSSTDASALIEELWESAPRQ
jgi:hypothetical protein